MDQDDEEFEKLLGEIPRATSAPPHLDELQKPLESEAHIVASSSSSSFVSASASSSPSSSSFLFAKDEVLRPHSEINSPASHFYNGLSLGLIDYQSIASQPQQALCIDGDDDDQALSSAFCKLNFEDISTNVQACSENGIIHSSNSLANGFVSFSNGGCSQNGTPTVSNTPGAAVVLEYLDSPSFCPADPFRQNLLLSEEALSNDLCNGIDDVNPAPAAAQVVAELFKEGSPARDLCSNLLYSSLDFQDKSFFDDVHQLNQQQPQNFEAYIGASASYVNGITAHSLVPVGFRIPSPMYGEVSSFCQLQQHMYVQREEERVQNRQLMRQQLFIRQQQLQEQQARFYASLQANPSVLGSARARLPLVSQTGQHASSSSTLPNYNFQTKHLQKQNLARSLPFDAERKQQSTAALGRDLVPFSQCVSGCHYYAQGFCSRGDACPFLHAQTQRLKPTVDTNKGGTSSELFHPGKILSRKAFRGRNGVSPETAVSYIVKRMDNMDNGHISFDKNHLNSFNQSDALHENGKAVPVKIVHEYLNIGQPRSGNVHNHGLQQQSKYTSLKEVEGCIYSIAKDQHGCRFLQRKFEEGNAEDVQKIFVEIIEHMVELMTDPFGNYLIQKLLEVCSEPQRMEILDSVSGKGQLVTVCLNMHGTRAVQKLIETLKSPEQVGMVISSLKQGVVTLIKDLNGNHVIQRCLQRLCNDDNQFIFDAAASHCVEIATHRHGCCVLQRCIDFASGSQRQHLVAEIASNALVLSQDPFGNYVVQYTLDLAIPSATMDVITQMKGNFACLSMQKFSSNVVEKCLKLAGDKNKAEIIHELMNSSCLNQLLQDPYANYVVQCALTVSKGALHLSLVDAINPHLPALRSSPYGRRILSRTNLKSKQAGAMND